MKNEALHRPNSGMQRTQATGEIRRSGEPLTFSKISAPASMRNREICRAKKPGAFAQQLGSSPLNVRR
jgi:hypothetical protein